MSRVNRTFPLNFVADIVDLKDLIKTGVLRTFYPESNGWHGLQRQDPAISGSISSTATETCMFNCRHTVGGGVISRQRNIILYGATTVQAEVPMMSLRPGEQDPFIRRSPAESY